MAPGCEESGINTREVVILGVRDVHDDVEEEVGCAEPASVGYRPRAEQREDAGDPEQSGERVHVEKLREEEVQRVQDSVLAIDATVVEELERGPVVMDLPQHVRKRDQHKQGNAQGGIACEQQAALRRDEQAETERDKKEDHRGAYSADQSRR